MRNIESLTGMNGIPAIIAAGSLFCGGFVTPLFARKGLVDACAIRFAPARDT
jgi:hypothetical protein